MSTMSSSSHSIAALPVWLILLLLSTFAVGTDDFVIAGVLPQLSSCLDDAAMDARACSGPALAAYQRRVDSLDERIAALVELREKVDQATADLRHATYPGVDDPPARGAPR